MLNMIDDESTDDELGVNLQLTQRLQINKLPEQNGMRHPKKGTKEFKQFYNERKKGMFDDDDDLNSANNSSSPELPLRGGWFVPDTPSPYHLGNKKRQNGDRGSEQDAKSKRTCLNDTFCEDFVDDEKTKYHLREHLPLNTVKKKGCEATQRTSQKKKTVIIPGTDKHFQNFRSNRQRSSKDISPDETYENHLASKIPSHETGKFKLVDTRKKREFNQYKKTDYAKPVNVSPSLPSTSKVEQMDLAGFAEPNRLKPVHRGVQFIDSDSDDENVCLKRGALKGGKQRNFGLYRSKKGAHKVLDTDDSDDSNWVFSYRNSHSGFSPSDSSGSNEVMKPLHLKASTSSAYDNNICSSAEQSKQSSSSNSTDSLTSLARNISFSTAGSNSSEYEEQCNDDACLAGSTKKSKNIYKQNRKKLPLQGIPAKNLTHQSRESSLQSTSRSRLRKCQKSPQKCMPSHSRFLRSRKNQNEQPCASPASSGKLSSDEQKDSKLTTRFPDVFDAEDGLEFFTANSYSTSESSNEASVTWNISSTTSPIRKHRSGATLEYTNVGDSSENEISVIFSTNSPDSEERNRRTQRRGSAKNRRCASGHEHSSSLISPSPDPVEQVRQMEEDERLARHLQAQFDAEVNEVEEPNPRTNRLPVSSDESETIDPVGEVNFIHDIINLRQSILETNYNVSRPSSRVTRGRRRGSSRGGSRHAAIVPELLNVRAVPGMPGVTVLAEDPWTWQFARMLGLGTTLTNIDSELDDYEVLLEIAEDIGEVVPRGLHKNEVNRLPTRQYMNPNANNDATKGLEEVAHKRTDLNKECQVCLCDYEHGDVLRILPCFHEFHIPCIDPWLKINRTCPVCRVVVNFAE